MKKYLQLYYDSIHNTNMILRLDLCVHLRMKLRRLIDYNPNFGRKRMCFEMNKENPFKRKRSTIVFNDDTPPFVEKDVECFLKNHNEKTNESRMVELPSITRYYVENNIRITREGNEYVGLNRF